MALFGQPKKAGGRRRDTPASRPHGRVIAQPVRMVSQVVQGDEPIGTSMMRTLFTASATNSPMANGNGGVTLNVGAGIVGRDARRTGPLQDWRQLHAPVANPSRSSLGIQAGPSSQPAFPSTGATALPSIMSALSGIQGGL